MSVAFTFEDRATPRVRQINAAANSVAAKQAVGIGLRREVGDHLRAKDEEPNKNNWPKTHFYAEAAESITNPEVEGDGVSISITQTGFRQRLLGGDIDPVQGKYLTIPASPLSYGKRAGDFGGLRFTFAEDDQGTERPALVSTEAFELRGSTRNRKGEGPKPPFAADTVLYWLVRHVHQEPDPTVLPTEAELSEAAQHALDVYLRNQDRGLRS